MRKTVILLCCGALIILSPAASLSATIHIPANQPTIQAGINTAINGDTVLVAPGIYKVNLDFSGKAIVLAGEFGPLLTDMEPFDKNLPIVKFASGETTTSVLTGFTLSHTDEGGGVRISGASPTIIGNYFTGIKSWYGNGFAVYITDNASAIVERNLFWNCPDGGAINGSHPSSPLVVNNTVYKCKFGINMNCPGGIAANNIVAGCNYGMFITLPWTITKYNDLWNNQSGGPGSTDISVDPVFVDSAMAFFELKRASGCIDAGDPNPLYNDSDGTRNDMGAFPFDQHGPAVSNLNLGVGNVAHLLNHTPTFYWSYYDSTYMEPLGYEIQVGTDRDWNVVEMWTVQVNSTPSTYAIYAGQPLEDGMAYSYRIRVSNGIQWGSWKKSAFKMNAIPSIPVLAWPTGQALVCVYGIKLIVNNSIDTDGDPLTYDFEIYSDAGLTQLVGSKYDVTEQPDQTGTGIMPSLSNDQQYWWRCRSYDGFQYSDWSEAEVFITRMPVIIRVPADQPTIQAGLDAAQERDTVVVFPGTYTGDGNRDLDFKGTNLFLKGAWGPDSTIIDCQGSYMDAHFAFFFRNHENFSAIVDGFTIKHAYTDELGAIYVTSSSPTIVNCVITDNECSGIYATSTYQDRQKITVIDCKINNNIGNGISTISHALIQDCVISKNSLSGVSLFSPDSVTVTGCLVRDNTRDGLNIETGSSGNFSITGNTFFGNSRGLYFYYWPPKGNTEKPSSDYPSHISYNIIAYNHQVGLQGDGLGISANVTCNDSYGNPDGDWVSAFPYGQSPADSLSNFSRNPLFCDSATGDFRIMTNSLCAAANNGCLQLIGAFDIGCPFICGDIDGNAAINILDAAYLIKYLYKGGPQPQPSEVADVDHSGNMNILDAAYLINYLYKGGPAPDCP